MRAWITKYALTEGILEVEGKGSDTSATMFCYRLPGCFEQRYAHGNDWHTTKEAAIARAEEMRVAKIKSLKKAISKFERMSFR